MALAEALQSQVPLAVRARGTAYFRSGAVTLESVDPAAVAATVRGSEAYEVELVLDRRTVRAACTCPYVDQHDGVCKHIWATVLAAGPRGFAAGAVSAGPLRLVLDGAEGGDWTPRPYAPPVRRPPERQTWADRLAAIGREVQPAAADPRSPLPPAERQLVYVLDAPATGQASKLVLEVQARERKRAGDWGKPKAVALSAAQIAGLADPLDRHLLALLGGAERGDGHGFSAGYSPYGVSRYRLAPPLIDTVLPALAQSCRVFLRRDPKPPVVLGELLPDLATPWELVVGVTRNDARRQWALAGTFRRGDEVLPLAEATLVAPGVIVWGGLLGRFDDGGAFPWVAALRRTGIITAPLSKADDLLARLLAMPGLPRLELPAELQYVEEAVPPRPRLVVRSAKPVFGPPVLHADLPFAYADAVVPADPSARGVYRPDGRRFLLRDPAAERVAADTLTRLGVRTGWAAGGPTLHLMPAQLPTVVRELVAAGWAVEADGKQYRPAGPVTLAVSTGQDWFDLTGAADFGGRPVPFPRRLEALRRGDGTVLIDDGSLGLLPEDWLKQYGLFGRLGTVEGDRVRFTRSQVGVLDALLAARPEVSFDRAFARARDRLRTFRGVTPADPPAGFKGELRPYQREGLGWLRFLRKFGFGGCLADDMGLGKTVQVLALLAGKRSGPALVVVPRSLVFNWQQEAARFAPKLTVLVHTGPLRDRTGAGFAAADLVLTTYGTLRNDAAAFAGVRFDTCVLDESQAAKNAATGTAKAVRVVRADHRLALSGTPVENHLGELVTLFDFLNPGMLGRAAADGAALRNPDADTRAFLGRALRPFLLRRTKGEVGTDLPPKTEQTVYCDLEPAQRRLYDELRAHYRRSLHARVDAVGLGRAKIQVLEALLRLRQAACHPGLVDKRRAGEPSAKLDYLLPQLSELAEGGSKVLVFSQFTSLLAIVRDRLDTAGTSYEYLDGRTRDRAERVARFQTDPACRLFLVSLKAGGVGLNLTAAGYVFLLDPWWNPAAEAQAVDRAHRIGQTKPVFAYRLIARDTVEEKVLALQASKRELADAILGGDGRPLADLRREDLELLLS